MPTLWTEIADALAIAKRERDAAGRSEKGRQLSLVVTKLEEALLWLKADGLPT